MPASRKLSRRASTARPWPTAPTRRRSAPTATASTAFFRSKTPARRSSPPTCRPCHGDLRVTEKFNLPSNVVSSFDDSFHGLSSRAGSKTVANCASCHGVHLILPSSDPRSMVNKANLATTCGKCHPGAGTRFAIGSVHILRTEEKQTAVFWIRRLYLWLIWLVIGGMVVHNLLDLRRKVLSPLQRPMIPVKQRPV